MAKSVKYFLLFAVLFTFCGCAGTVRFDNSLTQNQASADKTTIKVIREEGFREGSAVPAGIQDSTIKIGTLGPGGELTWYRDPGYVAAIVSFNGALPTHVVIFNAEAGKTYILTPKIYWGGRFILEPVNFPKDLIVYELKTESTGKHIPDVWKFELKKLSKQKTSRQAVPE